jgi:hypothetical protein
MRPLFRSTIASIVARALAYAAITTPAQAHTYEYYRRDAESFAQSGSFDTLAQCGAHAYAPIRTLARAAPHKNN